MYDKYVRVHRLVNNITLAPTGSDAQLDSVCRAMSKYFVDAAVAYAGAPPGTPAPPVADDAASIQTFLAPNFPGAAVTDNTVWVWVINEVTGQRQLVCYEQEVVLTQEKKAGGNNVAINPPIGVRVEKLMTIMSPVTAWAPAP